jgi:hypothetical protein
MKTTSLVRSKQNSSFRKENLKVFFGKEKTMNHRSCILLAFVAAALVLLSAAPTQVLADGAMNMFTSVEDTVWDPCAGEYVEFSGEAHTLMKDEIDDAAEIEFFKTNSNLYNVRGIGLTTGNVYLLPYVTNHVEVIGDVTVFHTQAVMGRVLNNALISVRMHITETPDGEVTAEYDIEEIKCTGRTVGQEPIPEPPVIE